MPQTPNVFEERSFPASESPCPPGALAVIPLGGLEEIGLNCTALCYGEDIIVVDAGLMFPEANLPGVDLVVPDFTFLRDNAARVRGLVLTHGHEDHIGALAFLLQSIWPPVYGTGLTLALTRSRLEEYQISVPKLNQVKPGDVARLGAFSVEFIRVNHSILDGVALAVTTPAGVVVHTGDFKIDYGAPPDERTDLHAFARYGERGVLALLSDSTNSDVPGHSSSEIEVGRTLTDIFQKAEGRVILACFASSLARIRQVALAARGSGRKLLFDGRSMLATVELGRGLGFLNVDEDDIVDIDQAEALDDRRIAAVVTGSQGEPLSALARMAVGEHRHIDVVKGDTIIFSARVIPGNERAIANLINLFHNKGAIVVDNRYHPVHASGHGHMEELKLVMSLTRPRYLVPVHGEPQHLAGMAALGRQVGLPEDRIKILSNGSRLLFGRDGSCSLGDTVPTGRMLLDGNRLGQAGDPVIRRRLKLADLGLVYVIMVLGRDDLAQLCPVKINIHGVLFESDPDLSVEAADVADRCHKNWLRGQDPGAPDLNALADGLKREVRSLFKQSIKSRPIIWPEIIVYPPGR
ncbi:MAG: ribonuclease J [Deltaproteobacteria bacterium]|nr:ribonuclease J [Deltaproteobacteria bacterium]